MRRSFLFSSQRTPNSYDIQYSFLRTLSTKFRIVAKFLQPFTASRSRTAVRRLFNTLESTEVPYSSSLNILSIRTERRSINQDGDELFENKRQYSIPVAMRYKPEGTRNISWGGGKGGRCVGLTTLPTSCADYHEI